MNDDTTDSAQPDGEEPELTDDSREAVVQALTKYDDVGVDERDGGPTQVIDAEMIEDRRGDTVAKFEVLVNAVGRLELDEVMERQGLLIYCREGVEVQLAGFQAGMLLVDVMETRN
jgi:hypothetical protein